MKKTYVKNLAILAVTLGALQALAMPNRDDDIEERRAKASPVAATPMLKEQEQQGDLFRLQPCNAAPAYECPPESPKPPRRDTKSLVNFQELRQNDVLSKSSMQRLQEEAEQKAQQALGQWTKQEAQDAHKRLIRSLQEQEASGEFQTSTDVVSKLAAELETLVGPSRDAFQRASDLSRAWKIDDLFLKAAGDDTEGTEDQ